MVGQSASHVFQTDVYFFHSAVDVDPVLPRITTPGRGDVGPDHMQTEEDSTIPSSVPVSSAQSSANIPSVKGDLHSYHHVFYIPTITMRILKYVDPEDLPKILQFKNERTCGQHAATTSDLVQLSFLIDRFRLLVRLRQD